MDPEFTERAEELIDELKDEIYSVIFFLTLLVYQLRWS